MTAEVVSVGTELLLGQIVDTHAPTMARILADCGISCVRRETVGDNLERIVGALQGALSRADLVVTIGGLGPTVDDLTRDAIAAAMDDRLERVPEYEERLRKMLAFRKIPWNDTIARQADRPASGRFIDNPNGSAPGLICEKGGKIVIALPGPRGEFNPMADGPVRDYLERLQGGQVIHSRILRICGMGESQVEEAIRPLMDGTNPTVAPYAHPGEVHLRVTARAASREEADGLIDPVHKQIAAILGNALFGVDATTLEEAVVGLLRERKETVSVAESMTGGGLGERLTNVSGSSEAFMGGVIAYEASVKAGLLGVDWDLLDRYGPVSEETARAMASNVRLKLGTTYGVSVTGNAGPTVDVDGKPVGLVFIGVAHSDGCDVEEIRFRGGRSEIRRRATQSALVALRNVLLRG
ncbi:MAG TPA: competence/damage-inducible protein A [Fimbriimonadaceae bacterium]|nr:competence/damage-inducible protein A [Fimbriimonadaceae bacterium]